MNSKKLLKFSEKGTAKTIYVVHSKITSFDEDKNGTFVHHESGCVLVAQSLEHCVEQYMKESE